jgi:hypothetical protein
MTQAEGDVGQSGQELPTCRGLLCFDDQSIVARVTAAPAADHLVLRLIEVCTQLAYVVVDTGTVCS